MYIPAIMAALLTFAEAAFCDDDVTMAVYDAYDDLYSVTVYDGAVWCGAHHSAVRFDPDDGSNRSLTDFAEINLNTNVEAIGVDGDGYVWARFIRDSSYELLHHYIVRYDGRNWSSISDRKFNADITCMQSDKRGMLWIGTKEDGLFAVRGDKIKAYPPSDELVKAVDIAFGPDDTVWFASNAGLFRHRDGSWQRYSYADNIALKSSNCIALGNDGSVWVGASGGLLRFNGTTWRRYTVSDGVINNFINDIAVDHTGNVWVATNGGVSRFDGSTWQSFTDEEELIDNEVTDIAVGADNSVWFCTKNASGGIVSFDGTEWIWHTTYNTDIPTNALTCVEADRNGYIWLGYGKGIIRFDGDSWTTFSAADGLRDAPVTNIYTGPSAVWIEYDRSAQAGITRYDGESFTTLTVEDGFPSYNYYAGAGGDNGILWLAGQNRIYWLDNGTWHCYPDMDRLTAKSVNSIARDTSGILWFATGNGLTRYDGASWHTFLYGGENDDNALAAVASSPDGIQWCLTDSLSLLSFDGAKFHRYPSENDSIEHHPINLAVTSDGTLWGINESRDCLLRFDSGKWTKIPSGLTELGDITFRALTADLEGNLWAATNKGLIRVSGNDWTVYHVDGPGYRKIHAMTLDADNTMWFVNDTAVTSYDGTAWTQWNDIDFSGTSPKFVQCLVSDRDNVKWFYTKNPGVVSFDGRRWEYHTDDAILKSGVFTGCAVDNDNVKWFVSYDNGIFSYNGHAWRSYTNDADTGFNVKMIKSVFADSKNRKWFITMADGVLCLDNGIWTAHSADTGFFSDYVNGIREDSLGRIWFTSLNNGVAMLDGDSWSVYDTKNGLLVNAVTALAIDKNNVVWVGCGKNIMSFDGTAWRDHNDETDVETHGITRIIVDNYNTKWISGYDKCVSYDDKTWRSYDFSENYFFMSTELDIFLVDYTNNIWFTSEGILARIACPASTAPELRKSTPIYLIGNYPNPFNSGTIIDFEIQSWGMVGVTINNIMGQAVRHIPSQAMPVGKGSIEWNGRDDNGMKVSSGVYFYRIEKGDHEATGRMMFLK